MFFTGRHTISVEESGRASLPAPLRAPLKVAARTVGDEGEVLYVFPSLEGDCLEAAGADYMAGRRKILARMKPFDPRREALERLYFGEARMVSVDSKGRVTLPADLRAQAGIVGEAVCVGMGDRFQIWAPEREAGRRAAMLDALSDLADIDAPEDHA